MGNPAESPLGRLGATAGELLAAVGESLASLTGRELALQPADGEAREGFGERPVYMFRLLSGDELVAVLALELEVAVLAGGALAMADEEAQQAAIEKHEIPEEWSGPILEAGGLLAGALSKTSGIEGLAPAEDAGLITPGGWPAVLEQAGATPDWPASVAIVQEAEERLGALLVAAAPSDAPTATADERPAAASFEHLLVQITGPPADPSLVRLADSVRACGARLVPLYSEPQPGERPDVLLIVSRSPSDLATRLRKVTALPDRPPTLVACSDRPTRPLVLEAKSNGAGDFLVLPTSPERLAALLARAAQPAPA